VLRHSSPRQVRKNRRELNLRKRIADWQALVAKHGAAATQLARECGVSVSDEGQEHVPGIPEDYAKRLMFIQLALDGKTATGRTPSAPEVQELPR
jgi:hypothetical protein